MKACLKRLNVVQCDSQVELCLQAVGLIACLVFLTIGSANGAMAAEKAAEPVQLEALVNDLKSSDPTKASSAAQALKAKVFPAKEAVPALAKAIRHPNEMVRLTVIGLSLRWVKRLEPRFRNWRRP